MYDDMWKVFVSAILRFRESTGDRKIELEASEWSEEVREVVLETAEAVELMTYEHFRPLRWLANLNSWSTTTNSKGANPESFFIANALQETKASSLGATSRSRQLSIPDAQVKEVEEFHSLILSGAS
jgi:hypothetical protein